MLQKSGSWLNTIISCIHGFAAFFIIVVDKNATFGKFRLKHFEIIFFLMRNDVTLNKFLAFLAYSGNPVPVVLAATSNLELHDYFANSPRYFHFTFLLF